ncbi:Neuroepithelial cell-transforming gene 1 protein, partial [Geodia barretti]
WVPQCAEGLHFSAFHWLYRSQCPCKFFGLSSYKSLLSHISTTFFLRNLSEEVGQHSNLVFSSVQPIPVASLEVEDVADGDTKISSGSFRGTLRASGGSGSKNLIKVSCRDPTVSRHSHTLQANGDFDKKAWLDAFQQILPNIIRHNKVTTV